MKNLKSSLTTSSKEEIRNLTNSYFIRSLIFWGLLCISFPGFAQTKVVVAETSFVPANPTPTNTLYQLSSVTQTGMLGGILSTPATYNGTSGNFAGSYQYAITNNPMYVDGTYPDWTATPDFMFAVSALAHDGWKRDFLYYSVSDLKPNSWVDFTVEIAGIMGAANCTKTNDATITFGTGGDAWGTFTGAKKQITIKQGLSTTETLSAQTDAYGNIGFTFVYDEGDRCNVFGVKSLKIMGEPVVKILSPMGAESCASEQVILQTKRNYPNATFQWQIKESNGTWTNLGTASSQVYELSPIKDVTYTFQAKVKVGTEEMTSDSYSIKSIECCVAPNGTQAMSRKVIFFDDFGSFDLDLPRILHFTDYTDVKNPVKKTVAVSDNYRYSLDKNLRYSESGPVNHDYVGDSAPQNAGWNGLSRGQYTVCANFGKPDVANMSWASDNIGGSANLEKVDHSGRPQGAALFINVSSNVGDMLYTRTLKNLCGGNRRIFFECWISVFTAGTNQPVKISVKLSDNAGNANSPIDYTLDGQYSPGWLRVSDVFDMTGSDLTIEIVNKNANRDSGNDLIIDDIKVMTCAAPNVNSYFDASHQQVMKTICQESFNVVPSISTMMQNAYGGDMFILYQYTTTPDDKKSWKNIETVTTQTSKTIDPLTSDIFKTLANNTKVFFRILIGHKTDVDGFFNKTSDPNFDDPCRNYSVSEPIELLYYCTPCTEPNDPTISGATVCYGSNAVFSLKGDNNLGVTYNINGGATATMTLDATGNGTITIPSAIATADQTLNITKLVDDGTKCPKLVTLSHNISVNPATVGGSVTGGTTICEGSASGLMTLSGHTGTIQRWQSSINSGTTWDDIANTAATYTSGNLTQTTSFRAVVKSGVCAELSSAPTIVTVNPATVSGSVTGGTTICEGSASGLLTLSGHTGTIQRWQSSINSGTTWDDIANTASTYTSGNLTQTTSFRAVVKSGACAELTSAATIVTVNAATVSGSVSGGTTICEGSASGLLTLSGHTGIIQRWQSSINSGTTWDDIANTAATYTSGNLTQTTSFRAVVKSGACAELSSAATIVTVNAATVSGSVSGGTTICEGSASGLLTLSGHTGIIQRWQSSINSGTTWDDIANTASTYTSGILTQTTSFRAVVKSGVCAELSSAPTIVTVNAATVSGSVTGGTTICEGSASGLLTLSSHTGTIQRWQSSINSGTTWDDITNTTSTYTSGNLTQTTSFRAVVKSGVCAEDFSVPTTVTVNPATVGGSVTGGTTICEGSASGLLTLSGHTGTIQRWQSSINSGTTWDDITNTTSTYTSGNLIQTSSFRAVVKSGVCAELSSAQTIVTVNPATVSGSVTGGTTICEGSASGLLTLSGHTGTIQRWQSSINSGTTWVNIANTSTTYTSGNLTQTTSFRAVVKSGVCAEDFSVPTTVTVNPATVGGSATGGSAYCVQSSSGVLTLSGHTGVIQRWQSTINNGTTWDDITNVTSTYTSGNLTQTTSFRAVVKSGVCPETYSSASLVTINPLPPVDAGLDKILNCSSPSTTIGTVNTSIDVDKYEWFLNGIVISNQPQATVKEEGTYTLRITNKTTCWAQDVVDVIKDASSPTVDAGSPVTILCGQTTATLVGKVTGTGNYDYKWTGGSIDTDDTKLTVTVSQANIYTLTAINPANNCKASSTVSVLADKNAPKVDIQTPDVLTCATKQVTIDGTGSDAGASLTYSWKVGAIEISNSLTHSVSVPATYTLTVTNTANNCSSQAGVVVSQDTAIPTSNAGNDATLICSLPTLSLNGNGSSSGLQFAYLWSSTTGGKIDLGATTLDPIVSKPAIYTLTVTNTTNGCTNFDEVDIAEDVTRPIVNAGEDVEICIMESANLYATASGSAPFVYEWTPGNKLSASNIANPTTTTLQSSSYAVTVTDAKGCSNSDTIMVKVKSFEECYNIVIPKYFTPNGDGINDGWILEGMETFPESKVDIYDRYGKFLISYRQGDGAWDGKSLGKELQSDDYWYSIEVVPFGIFMRGSVNVKR